MIVVELFISEDIYLSSLVETCLIEKYNKEYHKVFL